MTREADAVIVGGGPAGLAAATWLARYRRGVVVLDSGEYRNRWVDSAHGYLGEDPLDPASLRERALRDLERYERVEFVSGRAASASGTVDDGFLIESDAGRFRGRRVVLATGVADVFPEVENFFEHYGASVFHCPSCDGYEARDRRVAVFGWGEHVSGFALELLRWAREVVVVTDGRRFEGDAGDRDELREAGIPVLEDDAIELLGSRGSLRGVRLRGGAVLESDMAFFSIAHRPVNELAVQLGCELTDGGCVAVDLHGRTTVDGVFASGDLTPGPQLIQIAAAKGAAAGLGCALSFRRPRRAPAVAARPRLPGEGV